MAEKENSLLSTFHFQISKSCILISIFIFSLVANEKISNFTLGNILVVYATKTILIIL